MLIQGRLLTNPDQPPQLGYLRLEPPPPGGVATIGQLRFGELPAGAAPPDLGGRDRLVVPAFTDAHMHVPQIDAVGCDGLPLLQWLDRVVFPAEAWWGHGAAVHAARTAARRLLRHGTVGVAGYLTAHAEPARTALAAWAHHTPLRFHVGRVAMDRNAPDALTDEDRQRQRMAPSPSPLLPALSHNAGGKHPDDPAPRHNVSANPRFAVSCSEELLAETGWAVADRDAAAPRRHTFIQTHLSESRPEIDAVRALFPEAPHYTAVYENAKLLGPRTLLAHAVHLEDDEWRLIAQRDAVVVHCPTANLFLQSGLFDADKAASFRVRLALGSDVAGGPDVAMPRVARAMIDTAKLRKLTAPEPEHVRVPTPVDVWRLITETNAAHLGWPNAGKLRAHAHADLLVLRPPESWFDEHLIGRLIYNWEAELIEARVFNGALWSDADI